jgi:predicted NAD/FAD-binding protein
VQLARLRKKVRLTAVWLFAAELRDVRTDCAIASVESLGPAGPVCVRTAGGKTEQFDKVVLATHSDVSLALLGSACPQVSVRWLWT